mmetsp:Transcript_59613/g.156739  ORF Transcript_59613/g.156739 Transcript_59613/m.156739 type:complete len:256 (-) Transcript_59613:43-810(-)
MADAAAQEFKRWPKGDLEAFVTGQFKTFCKEPCAECGKPATKRFSTSMTFVVSKMLESFWCPECGRVLCEPHRYQHTCERLDQQKERNKHLTHEQIAANMAEAEALKEASEAEKRSEARRVAEALEQQRLVRKGKRQLIAKKAKHVEDFLQGISRDTDANAARGTRARDEVLELYTRAQRIALTLYNEYEHPSLPELADDDWESLKEIYVRARELTGMFIMSEDGPLDMRNPWDPPPPPAPVDAMDGAGLGRGVL